jgi:Holliday junction resolvase RusA-like endonuclease
MNLELPLIPISVNACWRASKGGHVYKSKRYREFLKEIDTIFETIEYVKLEGDLILNVEFFCKSKRKRDLDNLLKSLIDSLEGKLFENDSQIVEIHCTKIIGSKEDKTILSLIEKTV